MRTSTARTERLPAANLDGAGHQPAPLERRYPTRAPGERPGTATSAKRTRAAGGAGATPWRAVARGGLSAASTLGGVLTAPLKLVVTPVLGGAVGTVYAAGGGAYQLSVRPARWTAALAYVGPASPADGPTDRALSALATAVRLGVGLPVGLAVTCSAAAVGAALGACLGLVVGTTTGLAEGLDAAYDNRLPCLGDLFRD